MTTMSDHVRALDARQRSRSGQPARHVPQRRGGLLSACPLCGGRVPRWPRLDRGGADRTSWRTCAMRGPIHASVCRNQIARRRPRDTRATVGGRSKFGAVPRRSNRRSQADSWLWAVRIRERALLAQGRLTRTDAHVQERGDVAYLGAETGCQAAVTAPKRQ